MEASRRRAWFLLIILSVGVVLLTPMGSANAKPTERRATRTSVVAALDPEADEGSRVVHPTEMQAHGHHHRVSDDQATSLAAAPSGPLAPNVGGQWDYLPPFPTTFNGAHVVMGSNGKVLIVAGSGNSQSDFEAGTFRSYVWEPSTDARREVPTPEDLFCAGHTLLPDGRALVGGGTTAYGTPFKGAKFLYAFNFTTERYEQLTPLELARWYPSAINMPDGRTLFVSGLNDTNGGTQTTSEIFNYQSNSHSRIVAKHYFPNYPSLHLASNGQLFYSGNGAANSAPGFWSPLNGGAFQGVSGFTDSDQRTGAATCFFGDVRNQNLLIMGGGWPATSSVNTIKLNDPGPAYRAGPPLLAAKGYVSCVNLPDGKLFEAHGGTGNNIAKASSEVAMLSSLAGQWQPMNPLPPGEHRLYHSMLFVLDDGRVISMTSNPKDGEPRSGTLLAYSPPYLFKGTRPSITTAPTRVSYNGTYSLAATVAAGATLSRVAITTPPSPTHSTEPNQRYVSLPITNGTFTMVASSNILPPGYYRIWAVDSSGRPSNARWLRLS